MGNLPGSERLLSVVIVTHESKSSLMSCLEHLYREQGFDDQLDVLIVDSGSENPGYLQEALTRFSSLRVLVIPNFGYGTAINVGAVHSRGNYLVPMNPDVRVNASTLVRLAQLAEREGLAAVGPRLLDGDGSEWPSPVYGICPPWRRRRRKPLVKHNQYREVGVLRGAVMVVSRYAFDLVGGFDEGFFLYTEEDDLLARMAAAGERFGLAHDLFAVHAGEASSSGVPSGWRAAQRVKGRRRYIAKHYSWPEAVLAEAVDLFRWSRQLAPREFWRLVRTIPRDARQGLTWPVTPSALTASGQSSSD